MSTRLSLLLTFIVGITAGSLSGCNTFDQNQLQPSPTVDAPLTPTEATLVTATPTIRATRTARPTLTPTTIPTSTPTPMPTPVPDQIPGDFLFGTGSDDCELPCWMGLEIGLSDREDVYSVLDDQLGFDGYSPPPAEHILERLPPEFDVISHSWGLENSSSFGLSFYLRRESEMLEGFGFGWLGASQYQSQFTIQRILREMGTPSFMRVRVDIGGDPEKPDANITTMLLYDSGIAFRLYEIFPTTEVIHASNGLVISASADMCLGNIYPHGNGAVLISAPLANGIENLSPLQEYFYASTISTSVPIEEVTELTLQEITQLAQQQENPCIPLSIGDD